ncbi:conserved protein of unknown function [Paraburkholderia kururiensis]|jgi:hypothetical protein|uniref:hypothetical protein n=1 Tax=Paraburkholderia TaxID=1822464 RepID=UPI0003450D4E|nr:MULTISPECIES: hypothetical protein [Paraburkholderia]WEY42456.1 hypothetical protein P2869_20625 [Paraburkholderia sp. SUR17]
MSGQTNAPLDHEANLRAWLSEWYDYAVSAGFIHPPYELKEAVAERLEGYFNVGLSPHEGATVFFGTLH